MSVQELVRVVYKNEQKKKIDQLYFDSFDNEELITYGIGMHSRTGTGTGHGCGTGTGTGKGHC